MYGWFCFQKEESGEGRAEEKEGRGESETRVRSELKRGTRNVIIQESSTPLLTKLSLTHLTSLPLPFLTVRRSPLPCSSSTTCSWVPPIISLLTPTSSTSPFRTNWILFRGWWTVSMPNVSDRFVIVLACVITLFTLCLSPHDPGVPCITDCVIAELEKLGSKFRVAQRLVIVTVRIATNHSSFFLPPSPLLSLPSLQNSKRSTIWEAALYAQGHVCWWLLGDQSHPGIVLSKVEWECHPSHDHSSLW